MDRTSEELRAEIDSDEQIAEVSTGMAKLTWESIISLKRGWADTLDENGRLRDALANRQKVLASMQAEHERLRAEYDAFLADHGHDGCAAELSKVQERLAAAQDQLAKARSLNEFFRDAVGECHTMISRNSSAYQIRCEWEDVDLPSRVQRVMQRAQRAETRLAAVRAKLDEIRAIVKIDGLLDFDGLRRLRALCDGPEGGQDE